jgi:polysaccharide export outer membrane protein
MNRALSLVVLSLPLLVGADSSDTAGTPAAGQDFRIGVEDEVRIFVWGEAELSGRFRVRPDGKITVPLVQDIAVAGLTTEEVRVKVRDALTKYIRDPNVTVIVETINSYRVYFLGEINRQGPVQFYRPTRIIQGIAAAGGLTQFAKKEITLIREEGGVEQRLGIDYKRLVGNDPAQENFYLEPGDTLIFH